MSRFERWLYVVLIAVILVWPGVRRQFILQFRQITHTTDVRVGDWPKFTTTWYESEPVSLRKLERVAEKHGLWEGLAEIQAAGNPYRREAGNPEAATKSFGKALAAEPGSRVMHARYLPLHLRAIDFYRPEERAMDEKRLGRKLEPYPTGVSEEQANPALDWVLSGEKLDPQNSYYDYALALIYVGLHKDDEAIAAINAGSRKPVFNTYRKEVWLNVRQLLMNAGVPSLEATNNHVTSFSELARLRRLDRTLQAIALRAEQNGDWERGWRIRLAILRMGNQMIRNGEDDIDCLIGAAIQRVAMSVPLTREEKDRPAPINRADFDRLRDQATVDEFRRYSRGHNPGDQAEWMIRQFLAGREFARLSREDNQSPRVMRWYHRLMMAEYLWYVGTSLLAELLAIVAILGIFSLPRSIRAAGATRFPSALGILGATLTAAEVLLIGRPILGGLNPGGATVFGDTTLMVIGGLPILILVGAFLVLIFSPEDKLRKSLASIRTSARFALVVLALLYVGVSAIVAVERSAVERPVLQKLQSGPSVQLAEIRQKTGFRR